MCYVFLNRISAMISIRSFYFKEKLFHESFLQQKPDGSVELESAIASLDHIKAEDEDIYNKLVQVYKICSQSKYITIQIAIKIYIQYIFN